VLHGVDINSGELGRDLDLYIPNPKQAFCAAVHFSEILRQHGARWVSLMHPIWGPRCIGIRESDLTYWELHIITRINMGCIDFGELFPIKGEIGEHGFNFDPTLWFIKSVLQKYTTDFIHSRAAWNRISRDKYALAHKTKIANEFQKRWSDGDNFVSAVLGLDTDANLRARRKGLLGLMSGNCITHPMNAARAVARWLYRKGAVYNCSAVPAFGIDTTMESSALRDFLTEKLGHVFMEIAVSDQPLPWHIRKKLQARQCLTVFKRNERLSDPDYIDNWIAISSAKREEIDVVIAAILDSVVKYNERWSAFYRKRSLRNSE
jgi:hypothetical protein